MRTNASIRATLMLGAVASAYPSIGFAHHSRPTARPSLPALSLGFGRLASEPSNLELQIGTEVSYFDRLRQEDFAAEGDGALLVGTLVSAARLALASGTELRARLPVGFVSRSGSSDDPSDTAFGLGDAVLAVAQELLVFGSNRPQDLSLRVAAGLLIPTGLYRSDASLSFIDVSPGPGGALDVVTYDTQASLGAGVWSATFGLEFGWQLSRRLVLGARGQWSEPLTSTFDGISWGRDIDAAIGLTAAPWLDVLTIAVGIDYRRHTLDTVPNEETGERLDVGGRDELGVVAGIEAWLSDDLRCAGGLHLPVWQRVGGVQLVETVSVQASCGYRVGL